ncbi:MAG: SMC-Scp complex subunit ScpB [Anaerovoracaceae bacterium]
MSSKKTIKSAFESMMFIWGEPLEAKIAAEIFNIETKEALEYFKELKDEYEQEGRGLRIRQVEKSFQFVTSLDNSEYIERLCTPKRKRRLSQSALEVLSIVAYKQPITRGEIESIRGIKCDSVIEGLSSKGLVQEVGRSQGIGRPILFGTTPVFLEYFNIETLKDLPDIDASEQFSEIEEQYPEIDARQITIDVLDKAITSNSSDELKDDELLDEKDIEHNDE